jgi:hypothetical protein
VTKPRSRPLLSPARTGVGIKPAPTFLDDESEGGYKANCSNCSRNNQTQIHIRINRAPIQIIASANVTRHPIWPSFARNFMACAPGCQPIEVGVWRDPRIRPKPSCHHTGQAIDVGGMVCSGVKYTASRESRTGRGPFSDMVRCMHRKQGMQTLYMVHDHFDHAHFSNWCYAGGRRMY